MSSLSPPAPFATQWPGYQFWAGTSDSLGLTPEALHEHPRKRKVREFPSSGFTPLANGSGPAPSWSGDAFGLSGSDLNFFDLNSISAFDAPNAESSFGTFVFADTPWHSPPGNETDTQRSGLANGNAVGHRHAGHPVLPVGGSAESEHGASNQRKDSFTSNDRDYSSRRPILARTRSKSSSNVLDQSTDKRFVQLLQYFERIVQPPAAILVGGPHKWRRLRNYLVKLSEQSRAVASALYAVLEVLATDALPANGSSHQRNGHLNDALEQQENARHEIEFELSRPTEPEQKVKDQLLAATFLLAWFEVVRDQTADQSLFPSDLADRIIVSNDSLWNPYSKQLLQWLNTLDSKATHLGGDHLLSPQALEVVSHHPTQITTIEPADGDQSDDDNTHLDVSPSQDGSSPEVSQHHNGSNPAPTLGAMKEILLNTILQPALDWYLTSQSYNRRISSLDRHHRSRFTVKDEFEVITASKKIESELVTLWRQRPVIITLSATQLSQIVSEDVAVRLEEIFGIYLASFWVLFVYIHRVVWWGLKHSDAASRALEEVWWCMRRSYGEIVEQVPHGTTGRAAPGGGGRKGGDLVGGNGGAGAGAGGGKKKVVHPALLWPLFLFGSECTSDERRAWAIEQLEALGEAKPVPGGNNNNSSSNTTTTTTTTTTAGTNKGPVTQDTEMGVGVSRQEEEVTTTAGLPPFKLSAGATRNAKRAAVLLRELIGRQRAGGGARVDERELSIEMFGCHFSII